jgi:hypothetical protein
MKVIFNDGQYLTVTEASQTYGNFTEDANSTFQFSVNNASKTHAEYKDILTDANIANFTFVNDAGEETKFQGSSVRTLTLQYESRSNRLTVNIALA